MRLKNHQKFFIRIKFSDGVYHRVQLCWVVGVVIHIDFPISEFMSSIAAFYPFETSYCFLQNLKIHSKMMKQSQCSCSVFYIMYPWNFPLKLVSFSIFCMKIKTDFFAFHLEVIRVIIRLLIHRISLRVSGDFYSFSHKKLAVIRNQIRKILKALFYIFFVAIYIKMVGIRRSYYRPVW